MKKIAVSSDTKIQIWKQFTTVIGHTYKYARLCHPIQRYQFESNSQLWRIQASPTCCCVIRYKDTNLKAIHNGNANYIYNVKAVSSDTKIQIWKQFTTNLSSMNTRWRLCHPIQRYKFESNSQQTWNAYVTGAGCVIRYKDTNLKAIHNPGGTANSWT